MWGLDDLRCPEHTLTQEFLEWPALKGLEIVAQCIVVYSGSTVGVRPCYRMNFFLPDGSREDMYISRDRKGVVKFIANFEVGHGTHYRM